MDSEGLVSAQLSLLRVVQLRAGAGCSIFRLFYSYRRGFDCFVRRSVPSKRVLCRVLRVWWSLLRLPCRLPLLMGEVLRMPGLVGLLVCRRSACLAIARKTSRPRLGGTG